MATDDPNVMCYVGKAPCGHYRYACVDDPHMRDSLAEDLPKMIKDGYVIERKTVQWVREGGLDLGCTCNRVERK